MRDPTAGDSISTATTGAFDVERRPEPPGGPPPGGSDVPGGEDTSIGGRREEGSIGDRVGRDPGNLGDDVPEAGDVTYPTPEPGGPQI